MLVVIDFSGALLYNTIVNLSQDEETMIWKVQESMSLRLLQRRYASE